MITDVEYVMSLSAGESVLMKGKDGQNVLARVKGLSYDGEKPTDISMYLWEHFSNRY